MTPFQRLLERIQTDTARDIHTSRSRKQKYYSCIRYGYPSFFRAAIAFIADERVCAPRRNFATSSAILPQRPSGESCACKCIKSLIHNRIDRLAGSRCWGTQAGQVSSTVARHRVTESSMLVAIARVSVDHWVHLIVSHRFQWYFISSMGSPLCACGLHSSCASPHAPLCTTNCRAGCNLRLEGVCSTICGVWFAVSDAAIKIPAAAR